MIDKRRIIMNYELYKGYFKRLNNNIRLRSNTCLLFGRYMCRSSPCFRTIYFLSERNKLNKSNNLNFQKENELKKATPFQIQLAETVNGIKEDINQFLDCGLKNNKIYSSNVILKEPYHSGMEVKGRRLYLMLSKLARTSLLWYYQDVTLEITHFQLRPSGDENLGSHNDNANNDINFLSNKHRMKNEIKINGFLKASPSPIISLSPTFLPHSIDIPRIEPQAENPPCLLVKLIVEGTPRPALLLPNSIEPRKAYHVVFIYEFNQDGLVKLHKVQKIYPNPANLRSLFPKLAWWWWLRGSKPEYNLT